MLLISTFMRGFDINKIKDKFAHKFSRIPGP